VIRVVLEGVAELPLHEGRVPAYLLRRMKTLGSLIARYIVEARGPRELLIRLSDPFWFQAFNNVIGMDWDSSGSTTVVLYVLKSAFPASSLRDEGITVLGGKGRDAVNVDKEIRLVSDVVDAERLILASKLAAKVDSVALQDGYALYIHGLLASGDGDLLVIQQGMNLSTRTARRYHLRGEGLRLLAAEEDPHTGVACNRLSPALNLVDARSSSSRRAVLDIVTSTPPNTLIEEVYQVNRSLKRLPPITIYVTGSRSAEASAGGIVEKASKCPSFYRPVTDVKRVARIAEKIKEHAPREFKELLLIEGVGPETVRALVLVADLIYGYEPSFKDPTTHPLDPFLYAYAHGGKDGVPYRIKAGQVDKTIEFFAEVVDGLRAGNREKEVLLRNLSRFAARIKRTIDA